MPKLVLDQQPDVHYREWGKGDSTILILHGWPADSSHYAELGPLLAKGGYHVIAVDFPGWGKRLLLQKPGRYLILCIGSMPLKKVLVLNK